MKINKIGALRVLLLWVGILLVALGLLTNPELTIGIVIITAILVMLSLLSFMLYEG